MNALIVVIAAGAVLVASLGMTLAIIITNILFRQQREREGFIVELQEENQSLRDQICFYKKRVAEPELAVWRKEEWHHV